MHANESSTATAARFIAILNRVVELDRGPQPLLDWVRSRLQKSDSNNRSHDPSVTSLAAELDQLLRSRPTIAQTILRQTGGTIIH